MIALGVGRRSGSRLQSSAATVLAWTCILSAVHAQGPIRFVDVTKQTGIGFQHTDGGCGRRYLVESVSAGLALFDYDQDGDIDVYFLNGSPLLGTKVDERPTNLRFTHIFACRFYKMLARKRRVLALRSSCGVDVWVVLNRFCIFYKRLQG